MTTNFIIYTGPVVKRADAKSQGLKRYFTGKQCKHGHTSQRHVCNRLCIVCLSISRVKHANNNPQAASIAGAKYKASKKGMVAQKRANEKYLGSEKYLRNCNKPSKKMVAFGSSSASRIEKYRIKDRCNNLPYTNDDLVAHIERQFTSGMTWDNYGDWHIDHIVPVKWYVDNGVTDLSSINALSNLQPLWAADNLSKGSSLNYTP